MYRKCPFHLWAERNWTWSIGYTLDVFTWSRITMSVSSWRWQATFSLCFSETVRSATRVCFTWLSPRSSIKASICNEAFALIAYYWEWWIGYQYLTLPLVSLPLVSVPGSRINEWKSIVCRTLMSVVKLMFLSTSDTLSASLDGWTLKFTFVYRKIPLQQNLSYLFPLMRMSPLNFVPRPPCRLAMILHSVVPSSPKHKNIFI